MDKLLGPFWIAQLVIIGTLLLYSLIITSGALILLDNQKNMISKVDENSGSVTTVLIFDSNVENLTIPWKTVVIESVINSTLFQAMNSSLNLTFKDFYSLGVLITGINSIENSGVNAWTFEYFVQEQGWVSSPVGVSFYTLSSFSVIKWTYGPALF